VKISGTKYKELPDELLMQYICNTDSLAFNELYNRYKDRLLYYFFRMLGNEKEKAQDFLQDIFYKIVEKPEMFDPKRKFSTWIFSVAYNMCKNEYRRMKVREIMVISNNNDIYSEQDTDKSDKKEIIDLIFKELEKLEEWHKTAFLLRYREGFCLEEIGQVLDLPVGTIKSRLHYARKKILEKVNHEIVYEFNDRNDEKN
jgi:RNA polymerase sigma-70 factor, ECF subfamily